MCALAPLLPGSLKHPLNVALFDDSSGLSVSSYIFFADSLSNFIFALARLSGGLRAYHLPTFVPPQRTIKYFCPVMYMHYQSSISYAVQFASPPNRAWKHAGFFPFATSFTFLLFLLYQCHFEHHPLLAFNPIYGLEVGATLGRVGFWIDIECSIGGSLVACHLNCTISIRPRIQSCRTKDD